MTNLIVQSRRVLLDGSREPEAQAIRIENGKVTEILPHCPTTSSSPKSKTQSKSPPRVDCGDQIVMPGLVETHAHLNEPGRTDWEGFETGTRAAAAGGMTTLVDMPLNSIPPTTTPENLRAKRESVREHAYIDYAFWGGLIPDNDLTSLISSGVRGLKCFLCESGVEEFPLVGRDRLREGMRVLQAAGLPLLVHAELELPLSVPTPADETYSSYLQSRPETWEVRAIEQLIELMRETGASVHIVHLSAAAALPMIAEARAEGLPLTVETCPHYLTLCAEEIPDRETQYKCAPPIRDAGNRHRLWQGLTSGEIDLIVSDHSPCTPQLKSFGTGQFGDAWGGISGLQWSLPLVWTEWRRRFGHFRDIVRWMCQDPARLAGLRGKGTLHPGADADLVVWDPEESFTLTEEQVLHRHSVTPYLGRRLVGKVNRVFLRGQEILEGDDPRGKEVLG